MRDGAVKTAAFGIVFGLSVLHAGSAAAQNVCACQVPATQACTATVADATGTVFTSSRSGFVEAGAGSSVDCGGEIATGAESSAVVSIGRTCTINLEADTVVAISKLANGRVCPRVSDFAGASTSTAGVPPAAIAVGVIGVGIGGAVILSNISD